MSFIENKSHIKSTFNILLQIKCYYIFFKWCEYISSKVLQKFERYKALSDKLKSEISVSVVACIHASISSISSIFILIYSNNDFNSSNIYSVSLNSSTLLAFSCAYFLWDIMICFRDKYSLPFKLHAIGCFFVYIIVNIPNPIFHWHAVYFLLNELSTPFLTIRTLIIKLQLQYIYSNIFKLINVIFISLFFIIRIVLGTPVKFKLANLLLIEIYNNNSYYLSIGLCFSIIMWILNLYWFMLMIKSLNKNKHN